MSEVDELTARATSSKPLRLLFYDIETAPMLAYIWQLRTEYVGTHMLIHDTFMLSWAAKWSDGEQVHSKVLTSQEAKGQDDRRIVAALADLLRKADVIVAHNGDRFDLPMVNNRLLAHKLEPVGHTQSVDTLKIARGTFRLASNKLDYLAQLLGLGGKHDTDFDLWKQCYHGHGPSLKRLVAYNRQDVVLLERVFDTIRPYAKTLPRLQDSLEWRAEFCSNCGSEERKKDGVHRTKASNFQRWRCKNCGRRWRSWQATGNQRPGGMGL